MIRKVLLLGFAAVALVAAPVAAQETDYDGTTAAATVTEDAIVVNGEGFIPGATVNYSVDYEAFDVDNGENALVVGGYEGEVAFGPASVAAPMVIVETGTATADANGEVSFAVANRGEGRYTISMTDGVNTAVASVAVGDPEPGDDDVADDDAGVGTGGGLPRTGSDSSVGMAQFGVAAVALGAVALYGAKRRRAKAFAA